LLGRSQTSYEKPRNQWNDARKAVDRMSAGTFPFESVKSWFQISGGMKFSRFASGIGTNTYLDPFAWDENQEFYQFLGWQIHERVRYLFWTCQLMGEKSDDNILRSWREPLRNLYYFAKFPRECYVGEGNIVDVLYEGSRIWVLFDGNGGTGNLWLQGIKNGCDFFHAHFMDPSDPRRKDGSYLKSKRHPKLKDKSHGAHWCQFGQNRRVTTFATSGSYGNILYIATPDGVFCIGDNYNQMCNHTQPQGKWLNWTEVNTSAFEGVAVKQMYAEGSHLWFLLADGRIFSKSGTWQRYWDKWVMAERFKEVTSTNEIVDMMVHGDSIVLVSRTGSHYHRGIAPTNCIWTRNKGKAFNGTTGGWNEDMDLCDGVANDLGYISDADLWL